MWPQPTHGDPHSPAVQAGRLKPWRTAAEIIDWTIPCPSIFERKRPLAENTLRRIARGIQKYIIDSPEPFIVQVNHGGDNFRGGSIGVPMPTITAKHGFSVVAPTIIQYHTEQNAREHRGQGVQTPLQTVDASNRYGLAVVSLLSKKAEVAAFLSKYYGNGVDGNGSRANAPLGTVTAVDHNSLCTANIVQLNRNCIGQPLTEPLKTVTASAGHFAEVCALLVKYYGGEENGQAADRPLDTITCRDRFGLVTVQGVDYMIEDIGLRMLTPRELYRAQGFPDDYEIETDCFGHRYPKKEQVARCGNAVPPPFATALARANYPEYCAARPPQTMKALAEMWAV